MQVIDNARKEQEWVLREFDLLKKARAILAEREKLGKGIQNKKVRNASEKTYLDDLKRIFLREGRFERRAFRYERRLEHDLDKLIAAITKIHGDVPQLKKIKEQLAIYSREAVKFLARGGELSRLMRGKEINFQLLKKDINFLFNQVISPLSLLLEKILDKDNNFIRRVYILELESWGYNVGAQLSYLPFLIEHWESLKQLHEKLNRTEFWQNMFPFFVELCFLHHKISWEDLVHYLPLFPKDLSVPVAISAQCTVEQILETGGLSREELFVLLSKSIKNNLDLDKLNPFFLLYKNILHPDIWNALILLNHKSKSGLSEFYLLFRRNPIIQSWPPEQQIYLVPKFVKWVVSSFLNFHFRLRNGFDLFGQFVNKKTRSGKRFDEINIKEFSRFFNASLHGNLSYNFSPGDFVYVDTDEIIYTITSVNSEGYQLQRVGGNEPEILVSANQLHKFTEDNDWADISKIRKNGFLIIHSTNAYSGGYAALKGVNYDPFESIKRDIVSGDKYSISCSSISPFYNAGVIMPRKAYSIGVVLNKGKIVAAYMADAQTFSVKGQYRVPLQNTNAKKVPVRMALTSHNRNNELIPQKWRVGGVFYTLKTPIEEIEELKKICVEYHLDLYQIDEDKKKWKILSYRKGFFILSEKQDKFNRAA
jgi:hypothetical protein